MLQKHKNDNLFCTEASKSEVVGGIATINENLISIFKLPESYSIYTAEAIEILKTVKS